MVWGLDVKEAQSERCSYFEMSDTPALLDDEVCAYLVYACVCDISGTVGLEPQTSLGEKAPTLAKLARNTSAQGELLTCPKGHHVYSFLSCDTKSSCFASDVTQVYVNTQEAWDVPSRSSCQAPMSPLPPYFPCRTGGQRVPYSLVCDSQQHCVDNSDEDFCVFPPCPAGYMRCGDSLQCVHPRLICDEHFDCINFGDERFCPKGRVTKHPPSLPAPAIISIQTDTFVHFDPFPGHCPPSHFQCSPTDYCLPVYMRCNGVYDCLRHGDEEDCNTFHCPGYYRCRASKVCLHDSHVCDEIPQCPQFDDEAFCEVTSLPCPVNCSCYGQALICKGHVSFSEIGTEQNRYRDGNGTTIYKWLRYLHIAGSDLSSGSVISLPLLIHLGLANCRLSRWLNVDTPSLHSLDLSGNRLTELDWSQLTDYKHLRALSLSDNPLERSVLIQSGNANFTLAPLLTLDMSLVQLLSVNTKAFAIFPNLRELNMSGCGLSDISHGGGGSWLGNLRDLDLRGCPVVSFPRDLFTGMDRLARVQVGAAKLCCPAVFPHSGAQCRAFPPDPSACDWLLPGAGYRVSLAAFATLALTGNAFSLVQRVAVERGARQGFAVFVIHLCVSDFLMGVYLAVIGVADRVYGGEYLWVEDTWERSAGCRVAGFLCLVSSEVSAFIILLITLDRYLVLRFPFRQLRFSAHSAGVTLGLVWAGLLALSAVPLLPLSHPWQVLGHTPTCLTLPLADDFPGRQFAFAVVVVLNLALFAGVAAGQTSIYLVVRANSMPVPGSAGSARSEVRVARRLLAIAGSDLLCWVPLGVAGVMAALGSPIPREFALLVATAVLPLNSALNPFWYTFNVVMERVRMRQEQRLLKAVTDLQHKQAPADQGG